MNAALLDTTIDDWCSQLEKLLGIPWSVGLQREKLQSPSVELRYSFVSQQAPHLSRSDLLFGKIHLSLSIEAGQIRERDQIASMQKLLSYFSVRYGLIPDSVAWQSQEVSHKNEDHCLRLLRFTLREVFTFELDQAQVIQGVY